MIPTANSPPPSVATTAVAAVMISNANSTAPNANDTVATAVTADVGDSIVLGGGDNAKRRKVSKRKR
ncbi:hypothetical protein TWF718_009192 [Orbilia javanica]|uniref:Uncharacterized protein n=1 Tax=Orbilia javanica TaxID=47235 RepID=A0AAN8RGU8_9PEZI